MKKKLENFWYYYKLHILIGLFLLSALVYTIYESTNAKDVALNLMIVNAKAVGEDKALEHLMGELTGVDFENETIILDDLARFRYEAQDVNFSDYQQKIVALITAKSLDGIVADVTTFQYLSANAYFYDLRACLSEEQLIKYEPYLYYMEYPEISEEPIPVGIYLGEDTYIMNEYEFSEQDAIIGIIRNTQQLDRVVKVLDIMFEGKVSQ